MREVEGSKVEGGMERKSERGREGERERERERERDRSGSCRHLLPCKAINHRSGLRSAPPTACVMVIIPTRQADGFLPPHKTVTGRRLLAVFTGR